MILRKFMQHVKEQNWFAVGLDVIVVIVGIFLGLQVQAWYDTGVAKQEEQRIVSYMVADMEASQNYLEGVKLRIDDRIQLSDKLLNVLEVGELKPEDISDFEQAIIRHGRVEALDAFLNSFNEENLSRIVDSKLRRTIDAYLSGVIRINYTNAAVEEKMARAKAIRDEKTPIREQDGDGYLVYYNFDQLRGDDQYLASAINMNGAQVSLRKRVESMFNFSQLLLNALKRYQAGEDIDETIFEVDR